MDFLELLLLSFFSLITIGFMFLIGALYYSFTADLNDHARVIKHDNKALEKFTVTLIVNDKNCTYSPGSVIKGKVDSNYHQKSLRIYVYFECHYKASY